MTVLSPFGFSILFSGLCSQVSEPWARRAGAGSGQHPPRGGTTLLLVATWLVTENMLMGGTFLGHSQSRPDIQDLESSSP